MNRTAKLVVILAAAAVGAAAATLPQEGGAVETDPSWGPQTQILYRSGDTSRVMNGKLLSATKDWLQLEDETSRTWIDRDDVIYVRQSK